jgi:hypothetical protein
MPPHTIHTNMLTCTHAHTHTRTRMTHRYQSASRIQACVRGFLDRRRVGPQVTALVMGVRRSKAALVMQTVSLLCIALMILEAAGTQVTEIESVQGQGGSDDASSDWLCLVLNAAVSW